MDYKEIYNRLPNSWDELKLKDYIKLSPVINDADSINESADEDIYTIKHLSDLDKNIQIISLFSGASVEDIEQLPTEKVFDMINKLAFMGTVPVNPKTTIKYKSFSELSYDNFITFQKLSLDFTDAGILSSAINNLPMMLSLFSSDNLTEAQVLDLTIPEVIAGFFTVSRNIKKYLKRLERSSLKVVMKKQIVTGKNLLMQYWQNHNPLKRILTKGGTTG